MGGLFDLDTKRLRIEEINKMMLDTSFWNDSDSANKIVTELKSSKSVVDNITNITKNIRIFEFISSKLPSRVWWTKKTAKCRRKIKKIEKRLSLNNL